MYKGQANWEPIAKVKSNPMLRFQFLEMEILIRHEKAIEYKEKYGVDGVMIGRAAIGYPWIFEQIKHYQTENCTRNQQL